MAIAIQFKKVAQLPTSPMEGSFYYVGNEDIYFGNKKLNNAEDLLAAISRISGLETTIGILNGNAETEGSVKKQIADAISSIPGGGGTGGSSNAADIRIADAAENFTADNVEDALAELCDKLGTVDGQVSGEFVTDPIIDGVQQTGTYLKLIIGGGEPSYAKLSDMVDYNSVESTDEIILADNNHVISGTIGTIDAAKIQYTAADPVSGTEAKNVREAIDEIANNQMSLVWEEEENTNPQTP